MVFFYSFMNPKLLKRAEYGAHVAGGVVIHRGEYNGVHQRNHVLGAVGRNTQQHIRAEHVEQKHEVQKTGKIKHYVRRVWLYLLYLLYSTLIKKNQ